MKPFKFHNDTYHQDYYFFPGFTEDQYEAFIRKTTPRYSINLTGVHGNTARTDTAIYIWLRTNTDYGALVHECIHAANYTLSDRGIKVDAFNDEPTAYMAQWIYYKCEKHMKGHK